MNSKKIILVIISFFILLNIFNLEEAYAEEQTLESLDIRVFINDDGSATIRQRREGNFTEGTENYLVIENLGKSKIKDFKVFEEEREYEFIDDWNLDASREEKAFKNGIIETDDGYELTWGIGEYGHNVYFIEYTVTNFIKELKDNQVLFWRFVNDKTNIPPKKIRLAIQSDEMFNEEDHKVWGFGFEGRVGFNEGMVIAESMEPLTVDNYVTLLVKLEKGMFATEDYIDRSFEDLKDEAFEGSDYGAKGQESSGSLYILIITIIVFISIITLIFFKKRSEDKPGKFKRKFKEEYYRDYPYEGNILDIYYILYKMGLSDFENILTGFLLKWIDEGKITTFSEEEGWIREKEVTQIRILDVELPEEKLEGELYYALLQASAGNKVLEEKEFTKWAKSNYSYITKWEKRVKERSIKKLTSHGYLEVEEKRKFLFKTKEYHIIGKGKDIEEKIYKYINYLYDFSLINEHEAVNVKLWDNIMIWAGFLGITEVVRNQFEQLYPDYINNSAYNESSIYLTHNLTRNVSSAVSSGRSRGIGGNTSIGGGGGSFGGGSGGGTR